ncbi:hypothetical protein BDZ94DRAFT_191159 [Collybia nuda]|uniref:Uncharacterized protein n=1 Tax=Collybia nuda TaxID=64659 RepID=A0A9P5XW07_9AGAR|nr:hypothetical protein BDZ94DRAFT_191159 [Collybia nuda]
MVRGDWLGLSETTLSYTTIYTLSFIAKLAPLFLKIIYSTPLLQVIDNVLKLNVLLQLPALERAKEKKLTKMTLHQRQHLCLIQHLDQYSGRPWIA